MNVLGFSMVKSTSHSFLLICKCIEVVTIYRLAIINYLIEFLNLCGRLIGNNSLSYYMIRHRLGFFFPVRMTLLGFA